MSDDRGDIAMQRPALADQPQNVLARKFVRVTHRRSDGLVEFDFAIGEPEVFVELLLPEPAFIEFCVSNHVVTLAAEHACEANRDDWSVRLTSASRRIP
jgi:phenol hydroxylase P0 protein